MLLFAYIASIIQELDRVNAINRFHDEGTSFIDLVYIDASQV